MQIEPTPMDINAGMIKYIALDSKENKSNLIGTRHINPIPIINMPEFLVIINKSCLVIYLIQYPLK
jgi:hypothetical protein